MHENVELSGITKQIMPGPSGDLEEWQTLEVTLEPRHYLYKRPYKSRRFKADVRFCHNLNIFTSFEQYEMVDGHYKRNIQVLL